jgi:hypothetical protein
MEGIPAGKLERVMLAELSHPKQGFQNIFQFKYICFFLFKELQQLIMKT